MYNGYLDKCMPSEGMRNYLKQQDLWVWEAVDIVISAPVSINGKERKSDKGFDEG